MALITSEELTACYELLEDEGFLKSSARGVILTVLEVVSPEKLMMDSEKHRVVSACAQQGKLEAWYDLERYSAAIELQMPELWELHIKQVEADAATKKMAEFLLTPVDVEKL